MQAIERAREAGMEVLGVCCLVDREQGAAAKFADLGCDFEALFKLSELLED